MNIQIRADDITSFTGDAIIVPCNSELSYTKSFSPNPNYPLFKHESKKSLVKQIFEKGGKDLVREVTTIGFCEIGYAVITKGYELKAKNVIFMPIADHNNEESRINYVGLHQSLRAAFTLADLYKAKSVAIGAISMVRKRKRFWDIIKKIPGNLLGDSNEPQILNSDEVEDIVISISKDFEKSSINEVHIYKYSK